MLRRAEFRILDSASEEQNMPITVSHSCFEVFKITALMPTCPEISKNTIICTMFLVELFKVYFFI